MMQVKGVLLDPSNQVAANVPIRITTTVGYGDTLMSSFTVLMTNAVGAYDFPLVVGTHEIEVKFSDRYVSLGITMISEDTTGPLPLNAIMGMTDKPDPEYVGTIAALLDQALDAANSSEASAELSLLYANDSAESAASIILRAVAVALNTPIETVIDASNTISQLGPFDYVHDAINQKTWAKPISVGAAEVIVSVSVDGLLTTNITIYQLIAISTENNANTAWFDSVNDMVNSSEYNLKNYDVVKTKGRILAGDGQGAEYQIRLTTDVSPIDFKDHALSYGGFTAMWMSGISALTTRSSNDEFAPMDCISGGSAAISSGGGVLILGDSNTQGYGSNDTAAESYGTGFAARLAKSIFRATDLGVGDDRGYRYETVLSMSSALSVGGVTTTGSIQSSGGAVDSFLTLAAGQYIQITGREIAYSDVYYTAGTGALEFYLNGVLFATKSLTTGPLLYSTFPTKIKPDNSHTRDTDVIKIIATATVNITGLLTLRASSATHGCHVVVAGKSGWEFDAFRNASRAQNISEHMNKIKGAGENILVVIALGTNTIYNPSYATTPSGYIARLADLIDKYALYLSGDARFVVEIPPQSGSLFGTATGDAYLEYVSSIINFCDSNGHKAIRLDKSTVNNNDEYLFDNGVHFSNVGADIVAREFCDALDIDYNPHKYTSVLETGTSLIPYNDLWTQLGAGFANTAKYYNGIVHLKGISQPNASVIKTVGFIPIGMRPGRDMYINASSTSAPVQLIIRAATGGVEIQGVIPALLSLDGVSFAI